MKNENQKYIVSLSFEEISLPPFKDILVLGKKCPHGKAGIFGSLHFISPEHFEYIEVNDTNVEAFLVNKKILKRIPHEKIIIILQDKVFPFISKGDIIKVDLSISVSYEPFEI
jgi:hypothetical protein